MHMPDASFPNDATTYFSGLTDGYQRYRSGYPTEAIEHIMRATCADPSDSPDPPGAVIADIGCEMIDCAAVRFGPHIQRNPVRYQHDK